MKSGNCSALSKSKNVVNVSGVLNKFVREIGNSAIPAALNRFVSVSALLSFDDDDDDDDAIFALILLLIIFFPNPRRHEDARVFVAFLVATSVRERDVDVTGVVLVVVVIILLYASFFF